MSYCNWEHTSAVNRKYHDEEWGVPVHDDRTQFEFLSMEVMQCGLSWDLIINRREVLRSCFAEFDFDKVAKYTQANVSKIMTTEGMIKSVRKIEAIISNAKCFQQIRREYGSFDAYLWRYSENKTILYDQHEKGYIPVSNALSGQISRDLKRRGFKFLGPITVYSHLQACGIINDHDENCSRRAYINEHYPTMCQKCDKEVNVHKF